MNNPLFKWTGKSFDVWTIDVKDGDASSFFPYYEITNGGAKGFINGTLRLRKTYIKKGVNIGKSNERTAYEHCEDIAKTKFKDKIQKEGWIDVTLLEEYSKVVSKELDLLDFLDLYCPKEARSINNNLLPMKANSHRDLMKGEVVIVPNLPGYMQIKINGHRSASRIELADTKPEYKGTLFENANVTEKKVVIRSKKDLSYNAIPQIVNELTTLFKAIHIDQNGYLFGYRHIPNNTLHIDSLAFDGEIYRHGWTLQRIASAVKAKNPDSPFLELWLFDLAIPDIVQNTRLLLLAELLNTHMPVLTNRTFSYGVYHSEHLFRVGSSKVTTIEQAYSFEEEAIKLGFEGAMFRDPSALYAFGKRVSSLLKFKRGFEADVRIFDIIAAEKDYVLTKMENGELVEVDKHSPTQTVSPIAIYLCKWNDPRGNGIPFKVTPVGTKVDRAKIFSKRGKLRGKLLTIRYFEKSEDGIPKNAQGVEIKE